MEHNSQTKSFYITTTLPYVNSKPHMGHAMEMVRSDVMARIKKQRGYQVFFNTGTDEHGQKIYDKAKEAGKDTQDFVDALAEDFKMLLDRLGTLPDRHFIRTTNVDHKKAAQEFWKRCNENGFIYKKTYQAKYCVGCELEKTDSELNEEGQCKIHPTYEIQLINEENYFFKFSAFQDKLLELYENNPHYVVPDFRFNEIKSFVASGLKDFSISRLKEKNALGCAGPR